MKAFQHKHQPKFSGVALRDSSLLDGLEVGLARLQLLLEEGDPSQQVVLAGLHCKHELLVIVLLLGRFGILKFRHVAGHAPLERFAGVCLGVELLAILGKVFLDPVDRPLIVLEESRLVGIRDDEAGEEWLYHPFSGLDDGVSLGPDDLEARLWLTDTGGGELDGVRIKPADAAMPGLNLVCNLAVTAADPG